MTIESYLEAIEKQIAKTTYGKHPKELYEPLSYIMSLGGKRLRPALVLMAYHLFKENWQEQLQPALAVEVFHNFTLLHDDIMDAAPIRRGKPTVHEKWDTNTAILSGDVMLVAAYDLLGQMNSGNFLKAFKRFNRTAAEVCEGQQLDMLYATKENVTPEDYLEMIKLKTSVLLGFALELGGILAEQSQEIVDKLYQIGVNFGLGFQIKDDILDVFGDQVKVGKQVGGDIIENKKTWLMINAINWSRGTEDGTELAKWLNASQFDPNEKVQAVRQIYRKLEVDKKAEELMKGYFQKGFNEINELPASDAKKQILVDFGNYLLTRDK